MLQKTRVLHIIGSLNRGGFETWLMYLLRLQRPDVQFDFTVFQEGVMDEEARLLGSVIHYLPYRYPTILRHKKSLKRIIQDNGYDVVHYHSSSFSGVVMQIAAECGVPVRIDHAHNTQHAGKRFFINTVKNFYRRWIDLPRVERYATAILACSQEAGEFFFGEQWERRKPANMVYCGIPLESYDQLFDCDIRARLCDFYGISRDAIVIGTFGRLTYQKNHEFLINVFNELSKRDERYVLFIGGEGELRGALEKQVKVLSLRDRVFMPGLCSNVSELLCQFFDIFVLSSRFEGLPVCMLEAMAAGLHLVCSDSITKEMFQYIPENVTWQNLSASYSSWCNAIEEGIPKRISPREGISLIRKTPFEINQSMDTLLSYYKQM
ncbi:MAG: glycosyltransferase [Planctomycetaceae bacterium]|jgi:glycosyltransferase involved in cell wall biosynthesis|nr:glycosyltransferase [Planctomycetaceae bacterium]